MDARLDGSDRRRRREPRSPHRWQSRPPSRRLLRGSARSPSQAGTHALAPQRMRALARLRASFATAARSFSVSGSAREGRIIGWRSRARCASPRCAGRAMCAHNRQMSWRSVLDRVLPSLCGRRAVARTRGSSDLKVQRPGVALVAHEFLQNRERRRVPSPLDMLGISPRSAGVFAKPATSVRNRPISISGLIARTKPAIDFQHHPVGDVDRVLLCSAPSRVNRAVGVDLGLIRCASAVADRERRFRPRSPRQPLALAHRVEQAGPKSRIGHAASSTRPTCAAAPHARQRRKRDLHRSSSLHDSASGRNSAAIRRPWRSLDVELEKKRVPLPRRDSAATSRDAHASMSRPWPANQRRRARKLGRSCARSLASHGSTAAPARPVRTSVNNSGAASVRSVRPLHRRLEPEPEKAVGRQGQKIGQIADRRKKLPAVSSTGTQPLKFAQDRVRPLAARATHWRRRAAGLALIRADRPGPCGSTG